MFIMMFPGGRNLLLDLWPALARECAPCLCYCDCLFIGLCSHMTRWYSRVVMQSRGEELVRGLKLCLQAAMKKFHEVQTIAPS